MSTLVSIVKVTFTSNHKGCHRLFWRRVGQSNYQGPVYANPECSGDGNPCSISFSEDIIIPDVLTYIVGASTVGVLPNVVIQFTTATCPTCPPGPHGIPLGDTITANVCAVDPTYYDKQNATILANTANTVLVSYTGTGPVPSYVEGGYIREPANLGTLYYEGYVQACCEDEDSLTGRIPWTASYTPQIC
jgi:hypothetical protein